MRKKLPVKGMVLILVCSFFILGFIKQTSAIKRINADIAKKTEQLEEIQEKNKKLQAELEAAQSNYDYLEKLARERLGLIKDGEQVIIFEKPQE